MTPLEWVDEAIARHTLREIHCRIDALEKEASGEDYARGICYGNQTSHEHFARELKQLKELLAPRPPITAKEAGCPSCGATSL